MLYKEMKEDFLKHTFFFKYAFYTMLGFPLVQRENRIVENVPFSSIIATQGQSSVLMCTSHSGEEEILQLINRVD